MSKRSGPWIIALLVLLMLIFHQDNWFWEEQNLIFGFIPIGLYYHACLSVVASGVWFLATKIAWPEELIEKTKAEIQQHEQEGEE